MAYIKGNLKQIIFKSDQGFTVGLFKVSDCDIDKTYLHKVITFTGSFNDLKMDVDYIFYGDLVEHQKYGEQFLVVSYEQIMPESKSGIIAFLSSKLFPGVGEKMASRIVDTLGEEALDLISKDYHNLMIVQTMTETKAKKITEILKKENASYKIIINLQTMGFSMGEASKIYQFYKDSTMAVIEDNIYALFLEVEGIGFTIVDKIAAMRDIAQDDERRINACIIYIMNDLCLNNGNTYNDLEDIYLGLTNYLNFTFELDDFKYYLLKLNKSGEVVIEGDRYYLKKYHQAEVKNATFIANLLRKEDDSFGKLDSYIKKLEKEYGIKYNARQKDAIKTSFEKDFLVITGGPGTGKTTIIKAIASLYIELNNLTYQQASLEMALLAPTGRAAKRITEATGVAAMTIHKFLKWNKENNDFGINEFHKAEVKFVIVDEVSMIDNLLLMHLLEGLPSNAKIIFVGDHHQLPSVGPGEVLRDLIASPNVTVIALNDLYRQKENSYIVTLAHEIKDGHVPDDFKTKQGDYNFVASRKGDISTYVVQLCENALKKGYSYKEIQVLIPMYKGQNGIDAMNLVLQDVFNPKKKGENTFTHNNIAYRIGDKVLQIKNNNDLNISNGDIGTIENILKKDGTDTIIINFFDELIDFKSKDFDDIRLGYAISIHKAQGSEFDIVILPMDLSYNRMLYRKLIYTGVTRAKKALMIVGEAEAFKKAIINQREEKRKTSLGDHLDAIIKAMNS